MMDDLVHGADLDDAAGIQHRHTVAGLSDHAHVVRHQHHRRAVLFAQALEQGDDLRLDRDIERRGGLVGDDELGLGGQRQGDDDPLAHAAGELVRVLIDARFGGRDTGFLQQMDGALACLGSAHRQVRLDGLGQLPTDGVQRVERGQRVLEDGADLAATDGAHLLVRQLIDAPAFEHDLTSGNAPRRLKQADDGRARERLAGA